jgi:alpha-D-xyloside xylohydrolase
MSCQPPLFPYTTFCAEPPDLPERRSAADDWFRAVVKATVAAQDARGLTLGGETQTGQAMRVAVQVVAPGVVRVLLEPPEREPGRVRLARDLSDQPVEVSVEVSGGQAVLKTDSVTVRVDLDPFRITFYGADGRMMLEQNPADTNVKDELIVLPFGFSEVDGTRVAYHDTFTAEPDEHFYGFGEKWTDFDKRGQRLKMWHYDAYGVHSERSYKNVPFFVSTRGYGVFVDSVSPIEFDMAHSNHSTFSFIVPDSALDYYVIAGPDLKSVITRYASLVSFPTLPPKWAFGLWMSSGFERDSQDKVLARAKELRAHEIPCDVLHLDCYWQRHGCWSDLQWDEEMFPDPAVMLKQAKALGFKICLWMNPYIGVESPLLEEAKEKGYVLKTADNEVWIGDLWGGDGHFHPDVAIIDVTNPEAAEWFRSLLRPSLRMGADVYKTDFGEGIPTEVVAYNDMTGTQLHNLYPLLYNDLVAQVTAEEVGHAMVWGRCTYAGGQRHAAQWGGDPNCTYQGMASTLRGGLSMGMSGHVFWSHDIGGFHRQPTRELYVRWAQFGLLSPLSRAHGMTTRLPWDYGEEVLRIFRDYVRLRYRLLPYIYTYASLAHETGLPIMRAMVLEFPDDPNTYTMDLQYMFGAELMVAPIYNSEGRRPVYFPTGHWVDYWTHEVIVGPQTRFIEAPLDVLPLYVRVNALIPTIQPPDHLIDGLFDLVTFDAYLLDSGSFTLRDNDSATGISASLEGIRLDIQVEGAQQRLGLRLLPLPGVAAVDAVYVNGAMLNRVDALEITPDADVGWTRDQNGTLRVMVHHG